LPDRTTLKAGDKIRLFAVPIGELCQRERELVAGAPDAGWTADAIERIIKLDPIVIIYMDGKEPWFEYEPPGADGEIEYHSIMIMDDESWERV
jgi:hypothetical protein